MLLLPGPPPTSVWVPDFISRTLVGSSNIPCRQLEITGNRVALIHPSPQQLRLLGFSAASARASCGRPDHAQVSGATDAPGSMGSAH